MVKMKSAIHELQLLITPTNKDLHSKDNRRKQESNPHPQLEDRQSY
jgi:hypothetical protein